MATARQIDPLADSSWLEFVETSPSAEVFHHPRWLRLLQDQYGYEIGGRCVANGNGIEAGIPIARVESRLTGRRLVSLPFSDFCAPALAAESEPAAAAASLGKALAEETDRTGLPLTVRAPLPAAEAVVQDGMFRHLLALSPDPVEVEKRYSKSQVKRGIKKARKEGLRWERRTDAAALDAFYALHLKTRRKLGVPTQPKRFIRRFEGLFEAGLGFVGLVLDEDRPIAAAVFLTLNQTIVYKYGASDPRRLGKRPNNLLFSEAIRWACESGMRTLDLGRTEAGNEGLRAFKRSWGAEEVELTYTHLGGQGPPRRSDRRERLVGATIRRSPPFVGRLVGAGLYRHFG